MSDDPDYALSDDERSVLRAIDEVMATTDHAQANARSVLRHARLTICKLAARAWAADAGQGLDGEVIGQLREAASDVAGANCAFADDDLAVLTHLARRAVEAGLTDKLHPSVLKSIEAKKHTAA